MRESLLAMVSMAVIAIACIGPDCSAHAQGQIPDAAVIGQWKRYVVSLPNPNVGGNPFEVELDGRFTHLPSGRTVQVPGFYAGNGNWRIFFMPDAQGEWSYVTTSPDPELNGRSGTLVCTASGLPGRLVPVENRWRMSEAGFDIPVILPVGDWFKRPRSREETDRFFAWARDVVGARAIGITLAYFTLGQEIGPYVEGQEGRTFNIPFWDRLNQLFDAARDAGMGHYVRIYSDDENNPTRNGIGPRSAEELRLLRYTLARLGPYPVVIWDSGIDISEYRDNSWIHWFADWMQENDPWNHPVGSRSLGGSGGLHPPTATYFSDGTDELPSREAFVETWQSRSVSTAMTDSWREDYERGGFTRQTIRRAVWQMALTGGTTLMVSGNQNWGYLGEDYADDFKAAPDVGFAVRFFRSSVPRFGFLVPHDEFVASGEEVMLSADPEFEYVAYLPQGGTVAIHVAGAGKQFRVTWYDPLTGGRRDAGVVPGGQLTEFNSLGSQEMVLHLQDTALAVQ
jgi:hypothetical protein